MWVVGREEELLLPADFPRGGIHWYITPNPDMNSIEPVPRRTLFREKTIFQSNLGFFPFWTLEIISSSVGGHTMEAVTSAMLAR